MKNAGVNNGVIIGLAGVALTMVLYFISPRTMLTWADWLSYPIFIFFMWKAANDTKKANGGFISFGDALVQAIIATAIGAIIIGLFRYVHYNFIDPSLADTAKEIAMEAMDKMEGLLGESQVEAMKETIEAEDMSQTIGKSAIGILATTIFGSLISLVIAAIVKKDNGEVV